MDINTFLDSQKFDEDVKKLEDIRDFIEKNQDSSDPDIKQQLANKSMIAIQMCEILKIRRTMISIDIIGKGTAEVRSNLEALFHLCKLIIPVEETHTVVVDNKFEANATN